MLSQDDMNDLSGSALNPKLREKMKYVSDKAAHKRKRAHSLFWGQVAKCSNCEINFFPVIEVNRYILDLVKLVLPKKKKKRITSSDEPAS